MESKTKPKKRIVVSYKNLSPELLEAVKLQYPLGYQEKMIRIEKATNDFFYAIVLETEDISYLVKVDVKIDTGVEEEEEKDYFDGDIDSSDEIVADSTDDEE